LIVVNLFRGAGIMSGSSTEIMLDNLRESLRAAQAYYLAGITLSLFCAVVLLPKSAQTTPELPLFNIHAPPLPAAGIAGAAAFCAGLFALMTVQRARIIVQQLRQDGPFHVDDAMLYATLSYPALITFNISIRLLAVIPGLLLLGSGVAAGGIAGAGFAFVAALPYLFLGGAVRGNLTSGTPTNVGDIGFDRSEL
jgi:hypothetical protein